MRKILALLLSVMLICSSVGLGFAEGDVLVVEETDLTVDGLDAENADGAPEEVLMEAEIVEAADKEVEQAQETEEVVLFVDDSVTFGEEEAVEAVSDQETVEKVYLQMEAGKALFADADLTEYQVVLAEPAVVLGLFQETVYAVEYADAEGVKTAYASVYDVQVMDEEAVGAYEASVQDALTVDSFVLMPVVPVVEAAEEEAVAAVAEDAEQEVSEEVLQTAEEAEVPAETAEAEAAEVPAETAEAEAAEVAAETTEAETAETAEAETTEVAAETTEAETAETAEVPAETAEAEAAEVPAEEAVEEAAAEVIVAEEAAVEAVETAENAEEPAEEAAAEEVLVAAEETVQAEDGQALAVEEVTAELTEEEAVQIVTEDAAAQEETAEAEAAAEELQTAEEFVVSDEVITEDAAMAGSDADYIYEDPSTKTIISGYKVDAKGGDITIPATVKTIKNGAFDGNTKITSVSFAGSSIDMETGVFQNCTNLVSCALPELNNATNSVPDGLFRGCTNLKTVTISGNNIKTIGANAFFGCAALTSVSLGTQVETVGASAFEGCSSLVSIALGDNVKTIGSAAFRNCTEFLAYSMGNSVKTIGEAAFMNCSKLRSVTWSSSLKYIEAKAFSGCVVLGSVAIPQTVETIGASAFEGCVALSDLRFEGTATSPAMSVYPYAFRGCTALKSVDLPDRTVNVWQGAFYNCTAVTSVFIPKSVEVISEEAFRNCSAMTTLTFRDRTVYDGTHTLLIDNYAFTGCTSLRSAMLPARTKTVGKQAFYNDSAITEVEILGGQLDYIGESAFAGLNSNVWMTIWKKDPNNKMTIMPNAFGTSGDVCSYLGYDVWKFCHNATSPHWVPLDAYLHVLDCYNIILGRNWTSAEIAAYRQRFHNDAVTGLNIVEGLLRSSEFSIPDSKKAQWKSILTDIVFKTMVLRDPDTQGRATYEDMLSKGVSVYYQLSKIAESKECISKMALIGLKPGTIKLTENRDQNIGITYFVTRLYKGALNRHPDLAGLNNWTGILLAKKGTAYSISLGFFNSKEYENRKKAWTKEAKKLGIEDWVEQKVVETFYQVYLGRTPVSPEQKGWVDLLYHGVSQTYLQRGFVHSPEFTAIAEEAGIPRGEVTLTEPRDMNPAITYFVWRCYHFGLNRNPEAAGINDWCSQILNKKRTYDGVARGVLLSKEMENRGLSNSDWLEAVYHIYFDRNSDAAGKADWMSKLAGGATKTKILDGFSGSKEFSNLLTKLGLPK